MQPCRTYTSFFIVLAILFCATFAAGCTGLEYDQSGVEITSPADGATVTNDVVLEVEAKDRVDGDVGFLVEWSSDQDGVLGGYDGDAIDPDYDGTLTVTLTPGTHEIMATADLGNDGVFTDSVTITVE